MVKHNIQDFKHSMDSYLNPDRSQVQLPLEPDPQFPQITDYSTLQTAALSAEIVATTQITSKKLRMMCHLPSPNLDGNTNPHTPRTQREHGTTHGNLQHHDHHDQRPHVEPGSGATAPATPSADNSAAPMPAHLNPDRYQVSIKQKQKINTIIY